MELTQEQKRIVTSEEDLVINAVAGSGKTTTILEYARIRSDKRILYLAFNKSVKQNAQQLFLQNNMLHVTVETAHSLAYRHVVYGSPYRVRNGYQPGELSSLLGFPTDHAGLHYLKIAYHVWQYYLLFCNQTTSSVVEVNYPATIGESTAREFANHHLDTIIYYTRQLLARMDQGSIEITHDFYLKKFQLMHPVLPFDIILFDEGQDASPVMLDIFQNQPARRIIIGDSHQQIYGWRYAMNALENSTFKQLTLSCSFRFGNDIARLAKNVLSLKALFMPAPKLRMTGVDQKRPIYSRAIIGRTNSGLLSKAIDLAVHDQSVNHIYFEGQLSSYLFSQAGASLYDLVHLYRGNRSSIQDSLILSMPSFDDLLEYASITGDASLKILADLVMRYEERLPEHLHRLKNMCCEPNQRKKAEVTFSTVHKSKGMEYDEVYLCNDFVNEQTLLDQIPALRNGLMQPHILSEEVNMLYVAVTRTRARLHIPADLLPTGLDAGRAPGITTNMSFQTTNVNKKITSGAGEAWSRTEDSELLHLFVAGKPIRQIALLLNRNPLSIEHRIEKLRLWEKF